MTSWTIAKYGGSSLVESDRLARVAAAIVSRDAPIAVVVSALGGTTDALLAAMDLAVAGDRLAASAAVDALLDIHVGERSQDPRISALLAELRELLLGISLVGEASAAVRDRVVSFGERLAVEVVASALREAGGAPLPVDARTWLRTDDRFGDARVDEAVSYAAAADLAGGWKGHIPVITGYIGATADGRTTTLGRGGSDYTATLLGRALDARCVEIWTDVPGVMTADPAIVDDAWPLERMSYGEALELATFGARVLHPRTLVPLVGTAIPMVVRHTARPDDPGTIVDAAGRDDPTRATSVTSVEDQALIDLRTRQLQHAPELSERVHRALASVTDEVWLVTHSAHGQAISIVVPRARLAEVRAALARALAPQIEGGEVEPIGVREPVAVITLVAEAMGRTPNVAGRMFAALGGVGVNVHTIGQSATARSISCVVDAADVRTAVRTVHAAFHLTHQRISMLLLGAGTVGNALLGQIADQAQTLREVHEVRPVLVGVATSAKLAWDEEGLDPRAWQGAARTVSTPGEPVTDEVLDGLARLPVPVLVDCTAAAGMQGLYRRALERGIHIVAANKKPLTTPIADYHSLLGAARHAHRSYRYETTVGAALPVIGTLNDLVQTGDQVHRIEGSLSGTLGFLCDQLSQGVPIDEAVADAMERGFTEPRPQEDLAGTDAARKALILARHLGFDLEMEQVQVRPLVPADLLEIEDVGAFLKALGGARGALAAEVQAAREAGQVLRYLAVVDPEADPVLQVGPVRVGADHAAFNLSGGQSLVAFTTARYAQHPLIVAGAGAGGEVTASGVLADVLRIALGLRRGGA